MRHIIFILALLGLVTLSATAQPETRRLTISGQLLDAEMKEPKEYRKNIGSYIDDPDNVGMRRAALLVGKGKHQNATRCIPKSSKQNQLFSYVFKPTLRII
jgi:PhoPQ-activated pathogenicity-related protein